MGFNQKFKPGSVAAEKVVTPDELIYPDDMPTDEEFDDMGLVDLKSLAKVRFNVDISYRKKADAIAAIKEMFAAEAITK